jgi:hypothetical protein
MAKSKIQHITAERLREVLDYDPNTGAFRWRYRPEREQRWNSRFAGKDAGHPCKRLGYVLLNIEGRLCRAHRLAWLFMTGSWPTVEIDHADGDGLNNRWKNLRLATRSENNSNTRLPRHNTSGLKGAYFDKRTGRWLAQIRHQKQQIYLGKFDTAEEAHAAYCEAAARHHGAFARTA